MMSPQRPLLIVTRAWVTALISRVAFSLASTKLVHDCPDKNEDDNCPPGFALVGYTPHDTDQQQEEAENKLGWNNHGAATDNLAEREGSRARQQRHDIKL